MYMAHCSNTGIHVFYYFNLKTNEKSNHYS